MNKNSKYAILDQFFYYYLMKIISYSLFLKHGRIDEQTEKYVIGIKQNIRRARYLFPDWQIHIHVDNSIKGDLLENLKANEHVTIIHYNIDSQGYIMVGKRFICIDPQNTEIMVCRDADNLLIEADAAHVLEFENARKKSIFRYYMENRSFTFFAGGIAFKKSVLPLLAQKLANYEKVFEDKYGWDQQFLDETFENYERFQIKIGSYDEVFPVITKKDMQIFSKMIN